MPCSDCPFRTDDAACEIRPEPRWEAMKAHAAAGALMQCHAHIGPEQAQFIMDNRHTAADWHIDMPVNMPCTGAATAFTHGLVTV